VCQGVHKHGVGREELATFKDLLSKCGYLHAVGS